MDGACSTMWKSRGAYGGNLGEKDHLEDSGVDGRMI